VLISMICVMLRYIRRCPEATGNAKRDVRTLMEKGERLTWKCASGFPVHIDSKRQKHLSGIKMAHQEE